MNRIFDRIFKPFIGMRPIIWHWKAAAKPLLHMLKVFSNSLWLKSNSENRKISQIEHRVRIFDAISKRLIQLRKIIWRWKAYENVLLFHVKFVF